MRKYINSTANSQKQKERYRGFRDEHQSYIGSRKC